MGSFQRLLKQYDGFTMGDPVQSHPSLAIAWQALHRVFLVEDLAGGGRSAAPEHYPHPLKKLLYRFQVVIREME